MEQILTFQLEPLANNDPGLINLLEHENLPIVDLPGRSKEFFCLRDEQGDLVAAGGLEACDVHAILRSCVVASGQKGQGVGIRLIEGIIDAAREKQFDHLYLLTESAAGFFRKRGFSETERGKVPAKVAASAQFSEICPQNAVAMVLRLDVSQARD